MTNTIDEFRRVFKAARRAATPLLAIRTADPMSAVTQVEACLPKNGETPVLSWDILRGLTGRNEPGKAARARCGGRKS